jgi:hypothetical protein
MNNSDMQELRRGYPPEATLPQPPRPRSCSHASPPARPAKLSAATRALRLGRPSCPQPREPSGSAGQAVPRPHEPSRGRPDRMPPSRLRRHRLSSSAAHFAMAARPNSRQRRQIARRQRPPAMIVDQSTPGSGSFGPRSCGRATVFALSRRCVHIMCDRAVNPRSAHTNPRSAHAGTGPPPSPGSARQPAAVPAGMVRYQPICPPADPRPDPRGAARAATGNRVM